MAQCPLAAKQRHAEIKCVLKHRIPFTTETLNSIVRLTYTNSVQKHFKNLKHNRLHW